MAQVCGDSSYDFVWDRKHDLALRLLREVADLFCGGGCRDPEIVLAGVCRIYGEVWGRWFTGSRELSKETRRLHDLELLELSLTEELNALNPNASAQSIEVTVHQLVQEMDLAGEEWKQGDPEIPPTSGVLNVLEHLLFQGRFIVNPPKRSHPRSLAEIVDANAEPKPGAAAELNSEEG